MRKDFVSMMFEEMKHNKKIYFITADIGYGVLDAIRDTYPDRFLNVGCSEQLMIGVALGLAYDGYIPVCYSITPFVIYRPFELIRNYVNHESTPIRLVGCGRNVDYANYGISHDASDDIEILEPFKNIVKMKPDSLTLDVFREFLYHEKPTYLNLKRN